MLIAIKQYFLYLIHALMLAILWATNGSCFEFVPPGIQLSAITVNTVSTYTFTIVRQYDQNAVETPWNTQLVPANSTFDVYFPVQYTLLTATGQPPTCDTVIINDQFITGPFTVSQTGSSGNFVVKIGGAVPAAIGIATATISLDGIINVSPAITTSPFVIKIGNDNSANSSSAAITLQPAPFTSCAVTFNPTTVNTTGTMIVNITLANSLPRNGSISIRFPVAMQWAYDVSSNHQMSIQGNLACQLQSTTGLSYLSGISCTGSQQSSTITIQPTYFPNSTQPQIPFSTHLSFLIPNLFSPPTTQPADILQITSSYIISLQRYSLDLCDARITGLTPKTMNVTYSSNSVNTSFVNSVGGFKVSFVVMDSIAKTDLIRLEFPGDSLINYNYTSSDLNLNGTVYSNLTKVITFNRSSSAVDNYIGESHTIVFTTFQMPRSTRPTNPIRFVVLSARGYEKYVGYNTITAVNKVYNSTLTTTNASVSTLSNYTLSLTLTDPLSPTSTILLTLPSTLLISTCPTLSPSPTISPTPTCTISPISPSTLTYTVTLTNLNSTTSPISSNQPLTIYFRNVVNYYAAVMVGGIGVKIYYTGDLGDLVAVASSNGVQLVGRFGYVVGVKVVGGNYTLGVAAGGYQVYVGLDSGMPVGGGLLKVELDSAVKVGLPANTTINCTIKLLQNTNLSNITTQTTATLTISPTPNTTTTTPTILLIRFPQTLTYPQSTSTLLLTLPPTLLLRNPFTTAPLTLKVSSYDAEPTPNVIDIGVGYTSGVVFQARQVSGFGILGRTQGRNFGVGDFGVVVRIVGEVRVGEYVNGSIANITVPSAMRVGATTRCYSASNIDLNCTITGNNLLIPLDLTVTFLQSTPQSPQNTLQFTILLTSLTNPMSLKPTTPFVLQLQTPTTPTTPTTPSYLFGTDTTTLTIQNNATVEFSNITYNWSTTVYGGVVTGLAVGFGGVVDGMGGIRVDLGVFGVVGFGVGIAAYSGCTSGEVVGLLCTIEITNTSKVITITNSVNGTLTSFPSNFSITFANLLLTPLAPSTVTPNPYTISLSGLDSSSYLIYSSSGVIKFQPMCTLPCSTCLSRAQPSTCLTCYTDSSISPKKYLYNSTCYESCPSHTLYLNSTTFPYPYTCTECSPSCLTCLSTPTTCQSCPQNYSLYQHTTNNTAISQCILVCPYTTYARVVVDNVTGVLGSVCLGCVSPCLSCVWNGSGSGSGGVVCLECLGEFYRWVGVGGGLGCLVGCPADITVANTTTMQCQYCISPCSQCQNTTSNCTTCIPTYHKITNQLLSFLQNTTPTTPIYGYTCLQTCPPRTTNPPNTTICQLCTSPCYTCNNSVTECLSCVGGFYLSAVVGGSCVGVCQRYWFGNGTSGVCQLCRTVGELNCYDCISATQCNQCDDPNKPGYIYFPANKTCLSRLPDGYINNSGIAQACTSNCTLCSITINNCTQCSGIYNYYFNQTTSIGNCVQTCPSSTTPISNTCTQCQSPCQQCTLSPTTCTACLPQFYTFNGSCIEAYQCPLHYYINQTTKTCSPCVLPCSICVNGSFCVACAVGVLVEDRGTCVGACDGGFVAVGTGRVFGGVMIDVVVCLACLAPCSACNNTRQNCTSCISTHYFYQKLSRCYLPCPPLITTPSPTQTTPKICQQCTSPCLTCQSTPTTCLSCTQNHYLQPSLSTCVTACPVGEYVLNGVCVTCVRPCFGCVSASGCLSCVEGWVLFGGECVLGCPVWMGVVVGGVCMECQAGCVNCSTASVESSKCYQCRNPYALYQNHCYLTCPNSLLLYLNTTSNIYQCLTSQQYAQSLLSQTLSLNPTTLLPLPFTVIAACLCIITCMSRLQSRGTYIIGVLYCWFGLLEVGVLGYFLFGVYGKVDGEGSRVGQWTEEGWRWGLGALGAIGGLNLLGLVTQTGYLWSDVKFRRWAKMHNSNQIDQQQNQQQQSNQNNAKKLHQTPKPPSTPTSQCLPHKTTFILLTILSTLTTFKLKLLLFTGLFHFTGLSFPLQSIHKFRIFNVFSFLGMLQEGAVFYFLYLVVKQGVRYGDGGDGDGVFMGVVDVGVVYGFGVLVAVLSVRKEVGFFGELLAEKDQEQIANEVQQRQNEVNRYLTQKKQTQTHQKLTTLHPDLMGMDSYHSLKNLTQNQNNHQSQQVQPAYQQPQQPHHFQPAIVNRRNLGVQEGFDLGGEDEDGDGDGDEYGEVNHNILSARKPVPVASGNWVEVQAKDKEASYDSYERDKTILNAKRLPNNKSKIKNKPTPPQSQPQTKQPRMEKQPQTSFITQSKKTQPEFIPNPQTYTNILYKKQTPALPQPQPPPQQQLPPNLNLNKTTPKLPNNTIISQSKSKSQSPSNKIDEKLSNSNNNNNKAVLISQPQLDQIGEKNVDLSYEPILPFVHQGGQLKYREYDGEKDMKKGSEKNRGNIFDAHLESLEHDHDHEDEELVQVIQLQNKKKDEPKLQEPVNKQEPERKIDETQQKQPQSQKASSKDNSKAKNNDQIANKKQVNKPQVVESKLNVKQAKNTSNFQLLREINPKNTENQELQQIITQKPKSQSQSQHTKPNVKPNVLLAPPVLPTQPTKKTQKSQKPDSTHKSISIKQSEPIKKAPSSVHQPISIKQPTEIDKSIKISEKQVTKKSKDSFQDQKAQEQIESDHRDRSNDRVTAGLIYHPKKENSLSRRIDEGDRGIEPQNDHIQQEAVEKEATHQNEQDLQKISNNGQALMIEQSIPKQLGSRDLSPSEEQQHEAAAEEKALGKLAKQDIVKYYTYKREKQLLDDKQSENLKTEIQRKQNELSKIKNNVNSSMKKLNRRKSREALKIPSNQQLYIKRKVQKSKVQVHQKEQESLSIQIDEKMLQEQPNDKKEQFIQEVEPPQDQNIQEIQIQQVKQLSSRKTVKNSNKKSSIAQVKPEMKQYNQKSDKNNDSIHRGAPSTNQKSQKDSQQRHKSQKQIGNSVKEIHPPQTKTIQQSNVKSRGNSINQNAPGKKQTHEQAKNFSHASFDHKITIIDNLSENQSHNYTNSKPFEFDESSLKKARFQFEEDSQEKLSNPFDGSVHQNTDELLNQLNQGGRNIDQQQQDNDQLDGNHGDTLRRSNNDETVPFGTFHRNNKYNPITEENSEMEMSENNTAVKVYNEIHIEDRESDDEQQGAQRGENQERDMKESNLKVLEVLKSANPTSTFNKKRNKIPAEQNGNHGEIRLRSLYFSPPEQRQQIQNSLAKKQKKAYPIKQQKSKIDEHHDEFEEEIYPKRAAINQSSSRPIQNMQRMRNVQSDQQFLSKNIDRKGQQKVEKKNVFVEADSYANLVQWKDEFAKVPELSDLAIYGEQMDVPAKPIIDSQYNDQDASENMRQFDYEQTDKSYHRGKLYMFEQSPNIFERESQQRSSSKHREKSKSKKRRYSRDNNTKQKSPLSSLQKIYLQKLDKK